MGEKMGNEEKIWEPAKNFYHNVPPIANPTYPKITLLQTCSSKCYSFLVSQPSTLLKFNLPSH